MIRLEASLSTARFCRLVGVPERSYRRWQQGERQGRPAKGPWPSPSADRIEPTVVEYADRWPQWGSRTIATLMRIDGHHAPDSTTYRALKRAGRVLEVSYQADRRQHGQARRAAFVVPPTAPNQVWQMDFSARAVRVSGGQRFGVVPLIRENHAVVAAPAPGEPVREARRSAGRRPIGARIRCSTAACRLTVVVLSVALYAALFTIAPPTATAGLNPHLLQSRIVDFDPSIVRTTSPASIVRARTMPMVARSAPGADLLEDWLFDYKNRLAGYRSYNGSGGLVTRVDWVNDPLDRPISQATTTGGSTTSYAFRYVGASDLLSTETLTGATSATRRYTYDAFGRRATITDGANRYSYQHDPHGSVSVLLDQNGVAKASYGYGAYGIPNAALTKTAAGFNAAANAYRYTGKRTDTASNTLDMGARRYTPSSGRFLQADSYNDALANLHLSLNPLATNRYALAAGDPLNHVEVDGHYAIEVDENGQTVPLGRPGVGTRASSSTAGASTTVAGTSQSGGYATLGLGDLWNTADRWLNKNVWDPLAEALGVPEIERCAREYIRGDIAAFETCTLFAATFVGPGKALKINNALKAARAARAEGVVFRSFTRSNFRENLARRTGGIPEGAEAHHVFPQKFAQQFEQRGINVNDPHYGAWWETGAHRQSSYQYNSEWQQFLRSNPNRDQALDFGRSQAQRYGLDPGF